jgi:hypothetical protein
MQMMNVEHDDDDPGFAAWCERMCLAQLRRKLRAGLSISAIGWRTLRRFGGVVEQRRSAFTATFVERPDPTGARWSTALNLLLAAGREAAS